MFEIVLLCTFNSSRMQVIFCRHKVFTGVEKKYWCWREIVNVDVLKRDGGLSCSLKTLWLVCCTIVSYNTSYLSMYTKRSKVTTYFLFWTFCGITRQLLDEFFWKLRNVNKTSFLLRKYFVSIKKKETRLSWIKIIIFTIGICKTHFQLHLFKKDLS